MVQCGGARVRDRRQYFLGRLDACGILLRRQEPFQQIFAEQTECTGRSNELFPFQMFKSRMVRYDLEP